MTHEMLAGWFCLLISYSVKWINCKRKKEDYECNKNNMKSYSFDYLIIL